MSFLLPLAFSLGCDQSGDSGTADDTGGDTHDETGFTPDTNDTDTADTNGGTGYEVTDDESAIAALVGATLPASLVIGTFFLQSDAAGCPDVVDDGEGTITVTGNDCTSESGLTYAGTVLLVDADGAYSVTFGAWQVTSADFAFGADGKVDISGGLVFSGDVLTAHYQNATYGVPNSHAYTYADWAQQGSSSLFLPKDFSGAATIDGEPIGYTGSWDWADDCTNHPTSGSLVASGTNVTTFAFVSNCDACTPWTTDNGLSGEWCPV